MVEIEDTSAHLLGIPRFNQPLFEPFELFKIGNNVVVGGQLILKVQLGFLNLLQLSLLIIKNIRFLRVVGVELLTSVEDFLL